MIWHIIPQNDLIAHEEKSSCHCTPHVEEVNGDLICTHNSYDGREGIELAMDVLNEPGL